MAQKSETSLKVPFGPWLLLYENELRACCPLPTLSSMESPSTLQILAWATVEPTQGNRSARQRRFCQPVWTGLGGLLIDIRGFLSVKFFTPGGYGIRDYSIVHTYWQVDPTGFLQFYWLIWAHLVPFLKIATLVCYWGIFQQGCRLLFFKLNNDYVGCPSAAKMNNSNELIDRPAHGLNVSLEWRYRVDMIARPSPRKQTVTKNLYQLPNLSRQRVHTSTTAIKQMNMQIWTPRSCIFLEYAKPSTAKSDSQIKEYTFNSSESTTRGSNSSPLMPQPFLRHTKSASASLSTAFFGQNVRIVAFIRQIAQSKIPKIPTNDSVVGASWSLIQH